MASFSFSLGRLAHPAHAALQHSTQRSIVVLAVIGLIAGAGVAGAMIKPTWTRAQAEGAALDLRLSQTRETIAKLETEKAAQAQTLQKLMIAPVLATAQALNVSGYTEDDIAYWAKQMALFTRMTGIRVEIVGRSASHFERATRLTVAVSAADGIPLSPFNTLKALDFLQVYGYVESFDGKEAQVHIAPAAIAESNTANASTPAVPSTF